MNKKDITVGPRIVNRTNWTEELIKAGYIDGSQHKALTTAQEMQLHRNKELECLKLLATFLTVENLKEVKMVQADLDSFIVEANWVSEFLTTKLKENQLDAALLPELLAVLPEFYHTVKTSSPRPDFKFGMKTEYEFVKNYCGTEATRKHYFASSLITDPDTGSLLSGTCTDAGTDREKEFSLDGMKTNYPTANWDHHDLASQRKFAETLRDVEYYLEDMKALDMKDIFPELVYPAMYLATILSQPNVVYGVEMTKHINYPEINGEVIHPRHYYYNKESKQIIWFSYKSLSKNNDFLTKTPLKTTIDGGDSIHRRLKESMAASVIQILNIDSLPDGDINNGIMNSTAIVMRVISTGMALGTYTDMEGHGQIPRTENEKETTQTVKTNSRQKIVDNGKHKWPAAKTRKGHR